MWENSLITELEELLFHMEQKVLKSRWLDGSRKTITTLNNILTRVTGSNSMELREKITKLIDIISELDIEED